MALPELSCVLVFPDAGAALKWYGIYKEARANGDYFLGLWPISDASIKKEWRSRRLENVLLFGIWLRERPEFNPDGKAPICEWFLLQETTTKVLQHLKGTGAYKPRIFGKGTFYPQFALSILGTNDWRLT
jgi:hypothetical protein